jgi:hypothetical protein
MRENGHFGALHLFCVVFSPKVLLSSWHMFGGFLAWCGNVSAHISTCIVTGILVHMAGRHLSIVYTKRSTLIEAHRRQDKFLNERHVCTHHSAASAADG